MLTVFIHVEVPVSDETRALATGRKHGYDGRTYDGYEPRSGGIVLEFWISYLGADSSGPEQREVIDGLHAALSAEGIEFDARGNGVGFGSESASTFEIHGPGDAEPRLTVSAVDRAEFEKLLRLTDPALSLLSTPGVRIVVKGHAAHDPDTQEAPFTASVV